MDYSKLYEQYLKETKQMTENSRKAYGSDAEEYGIFLQQKGILRPEEGTGAELVAYLMRLKTEGKSPSTINRKLASLRCYYGFLTEQGFCKENPALGIKAPKVERKPVEFLSVAQVEALLELPDESALGIRDRALLELLYGAGLRAGEAVGANVEDVNLRVGFVACGGEFGKARIVPLGRPARAAMEAYIYDGRSKLLREKKEEKALFVNYNGERLTRQGIWRILKEYGEQLGLEVKLTPQILRNSFAIHMIQNGADMKSVQELLGSEDLSAIRSYLSVAKTRIKDVYDRTHPRA